MPSKLPISAPYAPAPFSTPVAIALKNLQQGQATPDEQKMALTWIINIGARNYDMSYRPGGLEGDRDSCFAEGKRFVGSQIIKLLNTPLGVLKQQVGDDDATRSTGKRKRRPSTRAEPTEQPDG